MFMKSLLGRQKMMLIAAIFALGLLVASPVFAGYSYNGNDFSYVPGGDALVICDREADGRNAYAVSNVGNVTDGNGTGSGCGSRGVGPALNYHATCEGGNCTDRSTNH